MIHFNLEPFNVSIDTEMICSLGSDGLALSRMNLLLQSCSLIRILCVRAVKAATRLFIAFGLIACPTCLRAVPTHTTQYSRAVGFCSHHSRMLLGGVVAC